MSTIKARRVLITGASSGIGWATAEELARRGHRVFGTSRQPATRSTPAGCTLLALDVCDEASVADCVAQVLAQAGGIDVLINNAGRMLTGSIEDTSAAHAQALFDVNTFGPLRMCRAVLPHMRLQGAGTIVNLGSLSAFIPVPFTGVYSASKSALVAMTEGMRHELREIGIRVTMVDPGFVLSPALIGAQSVAPTSLRYHTQREQVADRVRQQRADANGINDLVTLLVRAAESPAPPMHQLAGWDARYRQLVRWMPDALRERAVRAFWNLR